MCTGTVTSHDGTPIGWTRLGSGPPLVMVHCVAASRDTTPQPTLPAALAQRFTVLTYDRRGTGSSGNTEPYAVEREFEDLAAIVSLAGGSADVYGFSSGATLALQAAEAGVSIRRLALLEPPLYPDDDPGFTLRAEAQRRIDENLADARHWFNRDIVGVPDEILAQFPAPSDEDLENTRTIVHELTFLPGTPATRFPHVETPTLLIASNHTAPEIHQWATELEGKLCPTRPAWYSPANGTASMTQRLRSRFTNTYLHPSPDCVGHDGRCHASDTLIQIRPVGKGTPSPPIGTGSP